MPDSPHNPLVAMAGTDSHDRKRLPMPPATTYASRRASFVSSRLAGYCALLYESSGNFEAVARRTRLDRRTVKRYLHRHRTAASPPRANSVNG